MFFVNWEKYSRYTKGWKKFWEGGFIKLMENESWEFGMVCVKFNDMKLNGKYFGTVLNCLKERHFLYNLIQ